MDEKIVGLELAIKLKEKGFSEYTLNKYFHKKPIGYNISWKEDIVYGISGYDGVLIDGYENNKVFTYAPTLSFVHMWLREKHNIYIEISLSENYLKYNFGLYEWLKNAKVAYMNMKKYDINSYDEAIEYGIVEALKNIDEKIR